MTHFTPLHPIQTSHTDIGYYDKAPKQFINKHKSNSTYRESTEIKRDAAALRHELILPQSVKERQGIFTSGEADQNTIAIMDHIERLIAQGEGKGENFILIRTLFFFQFILFKQ